MKRLLHVATLTAGLVAGAFSGHTALAAPLSPLAGPGSRVDFSSGDAVIELSKSPCPYHGPVAGGCKNWYTAIAVNDSDRAATRVLQAGQPPGTGINFFSAPTRPQIAEVASSDDK